MRDRDARLEQPAEWLSRDCARLRVSSEDDIDDARGIVIKYLRK